MDLTTRQPMPTPPADPGAPNITVLVVEDMVARANEGYRKYGTHLRPDNGRDALRDAYEEALDLAQYLRQAIYERDGE